MYGERKTISITTDSSGDATAYSDNITGRIMGMRLIHGSAALDSGADLTITLETTSQAVLTITNQGGSDASYYPRVAVAGPTNTGLTYDGTRTVNEPLFVANERVKCVVAQGGNTKSATLHLIIG